LLRSTAVWRTFLVDDRGDIEPVFPVILTAAAIVTLSRLDTRRTAAPYAFTASCEADNDVARGDVGDRMPRPCIISNDESRDGDDDGRSGGDKGDVNTTSREMGLLEGRMPSPSSGLRASSAAPSSEDPNSSPLYSSMNARVSAWSANPAAM